jgi:hypothetical protein
VIQRISLKKVQPVIDSKHIRNFSNYWLLLARAKYDEKGKGKDWEMEMEVDEQDVQVDINDSGVDIKEKNIQLILEGRLMEAKKDVFSLGTLEMLENGEFIFGFFHVIFKFLLSVN